MKKLAITIMLLLAASCLFGAERKVDPTWLHRYVPSAPEKPSDITTGSCHYKPIFGADSSESRIIRSVARYAEVTVDPNGSCKPVSYPREEQLYYVLSGSGNLSYGREKAAVRKDDFMYLPPGIEHSMANSSSKPCRFLVMGFKIPSNVSIPAPPPKLELANAMDLKEQTVHGHPASTQYLLLFGDGKSDRDRFDSGIVVTSLFIMDFAPGGTNFPHHHEMQEEIYLVLDGHGDMVAGGGENGVEGRHPAGPGDAYFFRLNCTVGFYNQKNGPKAHVIAVRSWYPFEQRHHPH